MGIIKHFSDEYCPSNEFGCAEGNGVEKNFARDLLKLLAHYRAKITLTTKTNKKGIYGYISIEGNYIKSPLWSKEMNKGWYLDFDCLYGEENGKEMPITFNEVLKNVK